MDRDIYNRSTSTLQADCCCHCIAVPPAWLISPSPLSAGPAKNHRCKYNFWLLFFQQFVTSSKCHNLWQFTRFTLLDLLNLELNNAIFLRNIVNWNGITSILYSVNLKRLLQTERWYYYLFILYSCVDVDTPIFNIISSPLLKSPIISINQFERLEAARCESYLICFNLFFLVALLSEPYFVPSLTAYYTDITSRTEVIVKKRGSS